MNITTNNEEFNNKKFELEESSNDILKDLTNYIPNLLNHLWENPDLVALLLSNSNIKDVKDHLASFIVNNFYENILLSNSVEKNLMYVFTLMLKKEINNLENVNGPELFLNDDSPSHYLLIELIKKDSIRQYFKRVLLNIIENLEVYSSNKCFNLNIKSLQECVEKSKEKDLNEDRILFKKSNKSVIDAGTIESNINNFRLNYSCRGINRIEESLNETKSYKEDEMHTIAKFTEKYVSPLTIHDLKKMIEEKYSKSQNMTDYCRNQLINCGQNIINRDYYSNKNFMENLYCSPSSGEVLLLYQNDFLIIIEIIEQLFNNIKNTIYLLPYSIKCLCKIIYELIIRKFPDINEPQKTAFLAKFFFNQLLIPILQNPGFGLLIDNFIISKNTLNNIKIIIEIIDQFVSGKFFINSEKNSGFTPFNWYFLDKISNIFDIFEDIIKVNLPPFINKLINNNLEENYQFDYFNENPDEDMFYRAICFNLYDLNAILNNMNKCKDKLFSNSKDIILKKSFEKLNTESNKKLIEKLLNNNEIENVQKPKSYTILKFSKETNEPEDNKVKKKITHFLVTSLLTNDKYIELFNSKFDNKNIYSIKELKKPENKEDRTNNNIMKVKNFLICLLFNYRNFIETDLIKQKNTIEILHFLKEYCKNSNFLANDFIPLEWYFNSLLEHLKKMPDKYAENDFEKLYEEIEEELKIALKKVDFEIISTFFEKVKLAQREKNYYEEINRITNNLILNGRVQKIVEEEFIPVKIYFNYNEDKKEFYFTKSKMKEKDYPKKKAEKKVKSNFCKTIKSFTKKFPDLTECDLTSDIFQIQTELNIPEKLSQYLDIITEHLISNKKVTTSIDIEIISEKINDYIMSKIYTKIFPLTNNKKDKKIDTKCKLLVWTKPKHFIKDKENYVFDCFLKDAIYYFQRIDIEQSPLKKLHAIKEIFNSIYKLVKFNGDDNKAGIDDLMPILNYAFIKANPEKIYSNLKFLELYIGDLRSKEEGSQLTQLIALCDYINKIEWSNLIGITKDDFILKCGIISLNLKIKFDQF